MRRQDVIELTGGTADPAFAIDGDGEITAWNDGAAALFGIDRASALGSRCGDVLHGVDECGPVCSHDCVVRRSIRERRPMSTFDLQVDTAKGRKWCSMSVLGFGEAGTAMPSAMYVIRPVDVRKKLEMVMQDLVRAEDLMVIAPDGLERKIARMPAASVDLTARERDVLARMALGATTARIAEQLCISRTTANNHVQHILKKLGARTRLEAVRRAEHAGLV